MILDYLKYLFKATNEHGIHSPFVFDLYLKLFKKTPEVTEYQQIDELRNQLLKNESIIEITDFGAGSRKFKDNKRQIKQIAETSLKKPKLAKLIANLASSNNSKLIVELGTSLGLTTACLAKQNPDAQIITFEGCPEIAKIANENFKKLGLKNIEIKVGNINQTLLIDYKLEAKIDFVFIDANHQFEPTVQYFEYLSDLCQEDSIMIFDDIYWSEGMKTAWEYIKKSSKVSCSIDIFHVGIVFFRKKQVKEHFVLRY